MTGRLFLLVGPSGAGKSTLLSKVLNDLKDIISQMPTATTRPQRPNETQGLEHLFVSEDEFDQLIRDNKLVEWQEAYGFRYGTVKSLLEQAITSTNDSIADIDVTGAISIKEAYPRSVTLIFVCPPTLKDAEERIRQRDFSPEEEVVSRLNRGVWELTFMRECEYVIVNNILEETKEQLIKIILENSGSATHQDK